MAHDAEQSWFKAGAIAFVGAIFLLYVFSSEVDTSQLHVGPGFVDQIGYVTTARGLVETHEIESGLIYPAYADREGWRPYMPGHYVALALSFELLGHGVWASLAPNLIAFALACGFVAGLATRRYGYRAAVFAVLVFAVFPLQQQYAFTAMAETTFLAAGIGCLFLFELLGRRAIFFGPLLLVVPFLFRETGVLWIVPMVALACTGASERRLLRCAGLILACAVVLWGANAWQLADGKGALPLDWVAGSGFNYRDATATPPELPAGAWVQGALSNGLRNLAALGERLWAGPFEPPLVAFGVFVVLILSLLVWGWRRRREDPLPLAAAVMGWTILGASFLLYDIKAHKLIRSALFVTPLVAVCMGGMYATLVTGGRRLQLAWGVLLAFLFVGLLSSRSSQKELESHSATSRKGRELLERIAHDDRKLLIAPHDMFGLYAIDHYPVRCAFLPANDATLQAMTERFDVGTLVTPSVYVGPRMSPEAIRAAELVQILETPGGDFHVYQRRR